MRIFFACPPSANNAALSGSAIWEKNLAASLMELGWELVYPPYDVGRQYRESYAFLSNPEEHPTREAYSRKFVEGIQAAHKIEPLDLIFTYFFSGHVTPRAIEEVRLLGIPMVNFYCDATHHFDLVSEIAPHYDFCWVTERDALVKYQEIGANPIHIPMAANPKVYHPYDVRVEYDVTFVGQRSITRKEYISYLYKNHIDVQVWGVGWRPEPKRITVGGKLLALASRVKCGVSNLLTGEAFEPLGISSFPRDRCGLPLTDEELIEMYSRSKISLGFSDVKDPETGQIRRYSRLRDFEAPMSGAFYVTSYHKELEEYYVIGKEIVCYDTKEELLDKIRYYLRHETEIRKIKEAGLRRARQDHTWENRFRQLFKVIGLDVTK